MTSLIKQFHFCYLLLLKRTTQTLENIIVGGMDLNQKQYYRGVHMKPAHGEVHTTVERAHIGGYIRIMRVVKTFSEGIADIYE
jgi:hypothetical protein